MGCYSFLTMTIPKKEFLRVGCLYTIVLRYIMFIQENYHRHLLLWNNNNPGELLIAAVQGNIIVHA